MKNELINGRTPEQIKTGLSCSGSKGNVKCEECAYCMGQFGDEDCNYKCDQIDNDALALIEYLEAKGPKWISVKEQLPKYVISVFVYARLCVGGRIRKTGSTYISSFIPPTKSWRGVPDGWKVTHWMPKPEPPEEDEERHDDEGDHRGHHPLDPDQQGD